MNETADEARVLRPMEPELLNRLQAAKLMSISVETLRKLVMKGSIVPIELPEGGLRYSIRQIRSWIDSQVAARANRPAATVTLTEGRDEQGANAAG